MADDSYKTIKALSEGYYTEKRSRFISYAIPVRTVEEVKAQVEKYRKQYYDARHVCWAYMLGPEHTVFRANDDGEPSSTAGKPILGQIRSNELTDILVVVIRYFGGIRRYRAGHERTDCRLPYGCCRSHCCCRSGRADGRRRGNGRFRISLSQRNYAHCERRESDDCFPAVRDGLQNDTPYP